MREGGFNLGGEQSGHIVMSDASTTGDGLLAALQILSLLKSSGQKASEALSLFTPYPQILRNVTFSGGKPLENTKVQQAIQQAEKDMAHDGRILVRASGTEPVIRVMAEGKNPGQVEQIVGNLCAIIQKAV
jgi:phosphoglucosamine mutase